MSVSIFEIAKETIDETVVNKIKDDIKIYNSANNETKNEMFKIAAQKARIIEHYGGVLYETANDLAENLDSVENKLSLALNSGELSKESVEKINSSVIVAGTTKSRLKQELNNRLIKKGMKPLAPGDRIRIERV